MTEGSQLADWRSQVKQDLASLQMGAPESIADVGETINYAVELVRGLTSRYGVNLQVGGLQPGISVAVHPSVLRQVLIMAIAQLTRCVSSGQITVHAAYEDENVRIVLAGCASLESTLPEVSLIEEILAAQGGSVEVDTQEGRISFCIRVPAAGKVNVLVVEDNLDLLHFYRRCVAGTKYNVIHAAQGQRTVDAVQVIAPHIIVLDILLPDIDGWELLAQLHNNPATRSIPVILCSIVREEELASAYGAALYLPKPVQRRQFIQALDQVLDQALTELPRNPVNNAAAC
jgi:CheY-like chemotaxis protein